MIGSATSPAGEAADILTFYSPENFMGANEWFYHRPVCFSCPKRDR